MPLRPSISRQEYGTSFDWRECCETATARIYGTLGLMQMEWLDTFLECAPREDHIFAAADLPMLERRAAA